MKIYQGKWMPVNIIRMLNVEFTNASIDIYAMTYLLSSESKKIVPFEFLHQDFNFSDCFSKNFVNDYVVFSFIEKKTIFTSVTVSIACNGKWHHFALFSWRNRSHYGTIFTACRCSSSCAYLQLMSDVPLLLFVYFLAPDGRYRIYDYHLLSYNFSPVTLAIPCHKWQDLMGNTVLLRFDIDLCCWRHGPSAGKPHTEKSVRLRMRAGIKTEQFKSLNVMNSW